jgi:MFS family permease
MAEVAATRPEEFLPPGTVHLLHLRAQESDEVILVPKPSNHPDDPLNWHKWRKLLNISIVFFYVFTTGIGGTSVYSVITPISEDTGITIAELNQGTGYLFLLAGWSNLLWQPLALTFGRRPVILISLVACVAVTEWTAWIDNYPAWAAARCLYGFACAPVEVLPEICIPDIFFAHERGAYVGIYMMILCGSNFIAPLIAGFMNDSIGWHWVQHWAAILLGLNLILAFFFQEETLFRRSTIEAEEVGEIQNPATGDEPQEKSPAQGTTTKAVPTQDNVPGEATFNYEKKTYWQKLSLWSYSGISFSQMLTMAYRPFLIFFQFPNIMWAGFSYGSSLAW